MLFVRIAAAGAVEAVPFCKIIAAAVVFVGVAGVVNFGGDTHEQHESNIGKAGMAFPYRIKTEKELANALFRHDGRCIINGVIQPAEPPKPSFYHFAF